jgi:hypothetical protein
MKYIIILFALLSAGCYTKQQAVRKFCKPGIVSHDTVTVHDTVASTHSHYKHDSTSYTPPGDAEIIIPNPCDSITGKLIGFSISASLARNALIAESDGKVIRIKSHYDAVISQYQKNIDSLTEVTKHQETKDHNSDTTKVVTVEVTPIWNRIVFLILGLISIPGWIKIIKFIFSRLT